MMTENHANMTSELHAKTNDDYVQVKRAIDSEMKKLWKREQRLDIQTRLQLIKQQACELSKDEILELIFADRFGLARETGQFFTPNIIAELISVIGEIYQPKTVIDICCGAGNILSYFKSLQTVKGIDNNTEIVQLAQCINPNADIVVADALKYDFGDAQYDLVVGNLPFGAITSDKKSLEIELIKKGLGLLNDNGVAIFIAPESLLMNSASNEFRHHLISHFALDMVISLPSGIFPYTYTKTSIMVLRNGLKNQDVFMPTFEGNSALVADNFKQHKGDFYFPTSKISDRVDRNYYLSLETIEENLKGHELIKLSETAEIIKGKAIDKNAFVAKGKYLSFNRKDKDGNNFIDSVIDEKYILRTDDIVVSLIGPNNKIYLYKDGDIQTVITQNYAIIRPTSKNKYISIYLQTEDGINLLQQQINRHLVGSAMPYLNVASLSNIDI